jgi:hypothetical protein
VYPSQRPGTIPLYRYYNAGNGDHFYTTSSGELGGYAQEGIACYLPAAETRMDIVSLLPTESQRAFQAQGVFSGKTIDRRAEILASEQPVTAEACAILNRGAASAPSTAGARAARAIAAVHTTHTAEAELRRTAVLDRTHRGVHVLRHA